MNLDSLTAALSHIGNLIVNLTKKTLNTSVQEVKELLDLFGGEAEQHLYRVVLSQLEWSSSSSEVKSSVSVNGSSSNTNISNGAGNISGTKEKDISISGGSTNLVFISTNGGALQILIQQLISFVPLQRFATCFAVAISTPLNTTKTIRQGWVSGIFKLFKLTKVQEVVVCLQLLHSLSAEVRNQSISLLKTKLPELLRSYIEADSGGREIGDLSTETLHIILTQAVYSHRDQAIPILPVDLRLDFLSVLQKEFPRSQAPLVLLPILYPESDPLMEKLSLDSSTNMAKNLLYGSLVDFVLEMGYSFCSSVEECRGNLASFGASNITPLATAQVLGIMVKTQSGLQSEQMGVQNLNDPNSLWSENKDKNITSGRLQPADSSTLSSSCSSNLTWNVEVFVKALLEVVPNINAKEIILKLDYKGFYVKDKPGLKLLFIALRYLLQGQGIRPEHFPVECLYRQWKNAEEQLYFLEQILNNPDVFCFADYPCHLVATDGLKALPEIDNKAIVTWKSLELIELLLCIADVGHVSFVKELLKFPISHCPDVLILGLLQVNFNLPFTLLRQELIASILPLFLGSHLNSASILHHVWHTPKDTTPVRQIMMHAMAEWYLMSDNSEAQQRLSRILDVAQDLKALSLLLNAKPFMFVIDLACLAYRREYLKLDKWLTDKIRDHGEQFITACVKFLPRRCPQLVGGKEDLLPKSSQLPPETVSTMLACLQSCTTGLSQDLSDTIITMVQNCSVLNRPRQMSLSNALSFPGQSDSLGGMSSSLGNLTLGATATSSVFPPVSSSIGLGTLGTIGVGAPSSPARPSLPPAPPVQSSQSSLTSILPSLQLAGPPHAAVGSQLQSSSSLLSSSPLSGALRSQSVQPTIAPPRQTVDISQIFEIPPIISKEVEDEANSYFQRIYNHPPHPTLSIEEVLEMLKNFHESSNKRETEVYSCMLKNLFEEYRFFPTYPNRELILTASLFGGIIEQGLVEYIALGVALRYVVEALQKPHDSKMYYFGIVALDKFKSRLKEYPRYCHHLMAIEHFNEFPSHLIEYIKYGTQSQEPPNRPSGAVIPPSMSTSTALVVVSSAIVTPPVSAVSIIKSLASTTTTTTSSIVSRPQNLAAGSGKPSMTTTNIETLLVATEKEDKLSSPPDHIQDKIAFIFNNLSQLNLPQKCEELKDTLSEEYWPWVSQYLVMKRASIENNFHTLYSLFLDQLNNPTITNIVLQETLRNVKVLLRADKSSANFSDKSLLKNLGHWLGMLTLAKNQPILHIDVDVKSLLIEAYKRGLQELQYVVPFVAKVLESCAKSRVFKAPNPWTMAIMNVLAELHREPDMKLHLKFEIEVLCNKLELNVKDLKAGNILKNSEKLAKLKPQLSQPGGKRAESTPLFNALPGFLSNFPGEGDISTQSSSAGATPTPSAVPPTQTSTTPTQIQALPQSASEPRFVYNDISLSSLRCFDAHITISAPQIGNLETSTQLKQLVRHAVEVAVQDIIAAVMERSIKVANTTTEHIIKKDFALEPDESRMRAATHHIVRNLTAAMAMITSKDHLTTAIAKGIKNGILAGFNRQTNPQQMEQVDQLANSIAAENTGIACAFIQKTAAEKAVLEMDRRFAAEYDARKLARSEGRRYCDARVLTYQAEIMPEQIRLKVGRVTQQQTAVYEEFARNIPGFVPVVDDDSVHISKPIPLSNSFNSEEGAFFLFTERITQELEPTIQAFSQLHPSSHLIPMLHSLLEVIILCRTNRDGSAAQLLVKRAVENLLDGIRDLPAEAELNQMIVRFRDVHLLVLKAMADPRAYGSTWTSKMISKSWIDSRDEIRYNLDVIDWLLRSGLISVPMLDDHLARALEEPRSNFTPLLFIMQLVQVYLIDETTASMLTEQDLHLTLEALVRLCQTRQAPEGLINLIETLRMKHHDIISNNDRLATGSGANALTSGLGTSIARGVSNLQVTSSHHFHSGVTQARDFSDPPGLNEKTDALLRQWIQMYHAPNAGQGSAAAFQHFVKEMDLHGILKTDEVITRFFRICITMCRDLCIRTIIEAGSTSSPTYVRNKCFPNLDAFVRLIALLVKQSGEPSNPTAKINLLNKVLGLVCGILLHDIESHGNEFHQLPYHRILIMLFLELNAPETVLESINLPVLMAFTQTLHLLRPAKCPGFAYAWLEMVSHRVFIGRMLAITPQQKGWSMYSMLLTDLFKFLAPFLRNVELSKPFTMLYKGTLRVLLVLLHDFPEFLCEYHYTFCDVIPPNCIQMRNLILSAYPRNMRLPDPFMPNLKVDRLQEISVSPKIHTDVGALIQPELKKNLDSYLKNRNPVTFLSELRSYLQVSNEPGNCYNTSVMNALVLYVGMQAIAQIQSKGLTPSMPTIAHSAHMDIFENLAVDLDTEGRYLFLIAIANQLRYPNSHTHYFSCTLLYLFSEANTEAIQEQITRVLLERLIGNRPQPWGLLITFIELIKNPTFKFWSHEFVKCAPEIEKIFESVARSCMVSKGPQSERE